MPEPIVPKVEEPVVPPVTPPADVVPPVVPPVTPPAKTLEEIRKEAAPEVAPKETVGLDKFLDEKKGRKDAEKRVKELEDLIKNGGTPAEVSADIDAIAEKYPDVSKDFLRDIATVMTNRVQDAVKPLQQEKTQKKIDEAFKVHFDKAMGEMPEFTKVVNADVIKTLSLDPKNANKTMKQLIEETYGAAVPGKRTIDSTIPAGGKDTEPLDFARARKDSDYFDVVMANPRLKAEYNDKMLKEGW